jgi:hypothetical protein
LDIQTAAKGSSGPLSNQRHFSALEATILQQNIKIKQQNTKIEQQNIALDQLLTSLGNILKTVQHVSNSSVFLYPC